MSKKKLVVTTFILFFIFLSNINAGTPVIWTDCIKDSWERKTIIKLNYESIKMLHEMQVETENLSETLKEYSDKLCITISKHDLNSDGTMEILYFIESKYFCNRGCEFGIIVKLGGKYKKVRSLMCDEDISISERKYNSFYEIILPTKRKLVWKGNKYDFKK